MTLSRDTRPGLPGGERRRQVDPARDHAGDVIPGRVNGSFGPCRFRPAQQGPQTVGAAEFDARIATELAALPGIQAVTLAGSTASGAHRPENDRDFAIYYRDSLRPRHAQGH